MKRIIALIISLLIMGVIFTSVDLEAATRYLTGMDGALFAGALFLFIPQTLISALRWVVMTRGMAEIRFGESLKLVLAASALNIFLPSKMGDLSKAYFLKKEGRLSLGRGTNIVLLERYIDLCSLALIILIGILCSASWDQPSKAGFLISCVLLVLLPILLRLNIGNALNHRVFEKGRVFPRLKAFLHDSEDYLAGISRNKGQMTTFISLSILLWFFHLLQFYIVFLALHSDIAMFDVFRLVPLAIFFGLIPVTIAGIGTRDSALLFLFAPFEESALIVGVGLFASFRYLVPGLFGIPFLNTYIVKDKDALPT